MARAFTHTHAAHCSTPGRLKKIMNDIQLDKTERVRLYLHDLVADSKTPGIQYLALKSAETLFEYAGGWANIRRRVPMDSTTTMMAYSMSKTITAAAVLQLVEARQVGLDDPVDRYVDFSPYGSTITVRELLSHTSGIPNPIPLRWVHLAARHDTFDEAVALLAVLRKHPHLASQPGTKYAYSNIGLSQAQRVTSARHSEAPRTTRAGSRTFRAESSRGRLSAPRCRASQRRISPIP